MLENVIKACPENVWGKSNERYAFWYITYHTLFWLDFYLSEKPDNFIPPIPFTLSEFDPEGAMPGKVYSKEEMINYLLLRQKIDSAPRWVKQAKTQLNSN